MSTQPIDRSTDFRTAVALSGAYGVFGAVTALLLMPEIAKRAEVKLPLPLPVFVAILAVQLTLLYGVLGWCGLRVARRRGLDPAPWFSRMWLRAGACDFNGARWAGVHGLCAGAALVGAVWAIGRFLPETLPRMLHPPSFLSALCASTAGSIGEEILCRLFLLSGALLCLPRVGWARSAAIVLSALVFGALHAPAMIALYGSLGAVPGLAWVWIVGLNAAVGCVFGAAYVRWGIEAAIIAHWCCDLVWHVGSVAMA